MSDPGTRISEQAAAAPEPVQAVLESARRYARDRYLSALLAPPAARSDLVILAAYLGEVARIPLLTQEAGIAEIRLQWWRDALAASGPSGHPVADAVRDVQHRRGLDPALVAMPIEGTSRELYEDGIVDAQGLEDYAAETDGAAVRLALAILDSVEDPHAARLTEGAGRALAFTRLALALPQHLAHGRLPLPATFLGSERDPRGAAPAEARAVIGVLLSRLETEALGARADVRGLLARVERRVFPAILPLCLVRPYFKAIMAPKRDVLVDLADISPLGRVMRLWFAHWRGQI
ncbi:squalene/phytoene synthase family protein [Hyphomicrobium sp. CS1GBMeth3]|uniref:phytoene/squalene synthase family protein n=1 Tax=Hyphomicrobium sp. CS1GBMeth3 TaxID=1892845 RepID=UPI0009318B7D|nr:squalene/phytoene synthase family protein [Hyphomicrobium sp. CS1GBMeth3]